MMIFLAVTPSYILIVELEIKLWYRHIINTGGIIVYSIFIKSFAFTNTVVTQHRHDFLFAFAYFEPISDHCVITVVFHMFIYGYCLINMRWILNLFSCFSTDLFRADD